MAKMTEDMYPTQTTSIPTEGRLLHPKEEETIATTCLTSSTVLILEEGDKIQMLSDVADPIVTISVLQQDRT
jgi:hypothetical protein